MEPTVLAYIAGFLDGDGSVFFQLIRKSDYRLGFQIRPSVAFYQKTDNEHILLWLKEQLVSGSLRRRRTGISDYTIVQACEVSRVLRVLQPYVRLKQQQVRVGLEILEELPATAADPQRFLALCERVDKFRDLNYSKKRTVTSATVQEHLRALGLLERAGDEVCEPAYWREDAAWTSRPLPDSIRKQGFDKVVKRVWEPRATVAEHTHPFDAKALVVEGERYGS